jgi:hypothetical protein
MVDTHHLLACASAELDLPDILDGEHEHDEGELHGRTYAVPPAGFRAPEGDEGPGCRYRQRHDRVAS